jgi:hypothetical protein
MHRCRLNPPRKYPATVEDGMAELVNLRTARKQAKRRQSEQRASTNRLVHGQPKNVSKLEDAQQAKTDRNLDGHRIETGDGR